MLRALGPGACSFQTPRGRGGRLKAHRARAGATLPGPLRPPGKGNPRQRGGQPLSPQPPGTHLPSTLHTSGARKGPRGQRTPPTKQAS